MCLLRYDYEKSVSESYKFNENDTKSLHIKSRKSYRVEFTVGTTLSDTGLRHVLSRSTLDTNRNGYDQPL